jgi:polyisoprenoid-binding protein YceI
MKASLLFMILIVQYGLGFAQEPSQVKLFADKSQSSITYAMKHPLHSWEGTSKEINSVILTDAGRNTISQAAVSVKISSFDSQNANRDSHCLEVTDAIKYPNISFASTSIKQEGNMLDITGKLTFHGVTKEITLKATKETINNKISVTGNFSVNMKDYNIEPPSLMAMSTDEEIKMTFVMVY